MTNTIRDLMTTNVVTLDASSSATDAAVAMRNSAIGDVLVTEGGELAGVVTDRDLVVRCIADGEDPSLTSLGSLCSRTLVTLSPDDRLEDAVRLMEEHAVRRIPVVEDREVVGIVSIGDLALDREPESALGRISAAPPNA